MKKFVVTSYVAIQMYVEAPDADTAEDIAGRNINTVLYNTEFDHDFCDEPVVVEYSDRYETT